MESIADHVARRHAAELAVRRDVGDAMTKHALRLAMRDITLDAYRRAVLRDQASALALRVPA
ncbi:hypothetical protein [Aureimonas sp. AU12]|uniref:hypothetical protein n=1 Tax=Aureimonas sp. AU12 TaxID=1638161 RepID=UPI000784320F|nr:hypothetical protein [Aureimonas sp. AU12]